MAKNKPKTLLVVEDDRGLQSQLKWSFENYNVIIAGDRATALAEVQRHMPPVITLDLGLPPDPANSAEGFAALGEILDIHPNAKIIVVTGNDEHENAVRAIGLGAYDFCGKPIDPEMLGLIVQRAFRVYELEEENRRLAKTAASSPLANVITSSPSMTKVCRMVERIAATNVTTLMLGESGTGKEVLVRALHQLSDRSDRPFVAINCAAIPENLLESELFGYERGAFTGATKQTLGKIECANRGTLFLDEVGDLPLALQSKLLRFLQERVIERVGGRAEIPVDVRVVCATHQDLPKLAEAGAFREDLFYRISEVTISIPPLRERPGDVFLLANAFLLKYADEFKRKLKRFTPAALAAMEKHVWPGNVRELESCIKRAVIMAEGSQIEVEDLGLQSGAGDAANLDLRHVREVAETDAIQRAMGLCGDNVSAAAKMLGVTRPTLYDLMEKYNLK